jgi:hypothetical protein
VCEKGGVSIAYGSLLLLRGESASYLNVLLAAEYPTAVAPKTSGKAFGETSSSAIYISRRPVEDTTFDVKRSRICNNAAHKPLTLVCPFCEAKPDDDCATSSGGFSILHVARIQAAAAKDVANPHAPEATRLTPVLSPHTLYCST